MAQHTDKLNGKIIVITGASSGFGRGSAIRLAGMGAHVVGAARRSDVLEALSAEDQTGYRLYNKSRIIPVTAL